MTKIIKHPFFPVADPDSRVLILGTFPSVTSREVQFYYGHPQNRFWRLLAAIFEEPVPATLEEKTAFLHRHHVALWDVVASCEIQQSQDASIRHAEPQDIPSLVEKTKIRCILCNGSAAFRLYQTHFGNTLDLPVLGLPSTSPANAAWSLERLLPVWREALLNANDGGSKKDPTSPGEF